MSSMPINYDKPIRIRDFRNGSWFWIQTHVWEDKRLTKSDKIIYGTIAKYANNKTQRSFPSITTIANDSNSSKRQVYYSLSNLEKLGYVGVVRRRGKYNDYSLLKTLPEGSATTAPVEGEGVQKSSQPSADFAPTGAENDLRTILNNKTLKTKDLKVRLKEKDPDLYRRLYGEKP